MNNGFYFQLLANLAQGSGRLVYPRFLKDVVKSADLDDVNAIAEALTKEVNDASAVEGGGVAYLTLIAENALLFSLYRQDYERFRAIADIMEKRFFSFRSQGVDFRSDSWEAYLRIVRSCGKRMMRVGTIEEFERLIDDLEWDQFSPEFVNRVCRAIGLTYLHEEDQDRFNKTRFWLHKSTQGVDFSETIAAQVGLVEYFLADPTNDNLKRVDDIIRTLEETAGKESDAGLEKVYRALLLSVQARAVVAKAFSGKESYDDDQVKVEQSLRIVRDLSKNFDSEAAKMSPFVRGYMKLNFAKFYYDSAAADIDKDDMVDLMAMALEDLNEALAIAKKSKDESLRDAASIKRLTVLSRHANKTTEKEMKEALAEVRKGENYQSLVELSSAASYYYNHVKNGSIKAYEVLFDTVRRGQKRLNEGGFFLVVKGIAGINDILIKETIRPGVSWMVKELNTYFDTLSEIIDAIEANGDHVGSDLFAKFQEEFLRMEPATHFNLKTYLRYQYTEVKILRLAAWMRGDNVSQRVAEKLLFELGEDNNPLTFIRAAWEEFKDVPNSVRNKVINKCISISKGDLPLAAEHLDFSYRNLRSYITFKEVNRLGFFLDEQQTTNRQLETGIRLLFFDLYKNGTIFEVVFDMPKFLVEHAKSGFSSQDLEEALDIKGTTAKKYIKIMMEIGLIKLERSVGRKHFYKLRKDNVMTRLGKEQKVLAS
jgi:hypothetical protein